MAREYKIGEAFTTQTGNTYCAVENKSGRPCDKCAFFRSHFWCGRPVWECLATDLRCYDRTDGKIVYFKRVE